MRKFALPALLAAALVYAAIGSAGNGRETHFGPFASSSTDNGSCGQPWAQDTYQRDFKVMDNGDGTFRVRVEYKQGSFVTTGPVSPGACEADSHHGTTLRPGVTGTMHGYLEGTVTSATFNPNGCSAASADCTTNGGFITAVFGPTASFTCFNGYADCSFNFEYAAGDQGLLFHHWQDASTNTPGGEIFRGDVADG